jgi:hypothetical protein
MDKVQVALQATIHIHGILYLVGTIGIFLQAARNSWFLQNHAAAKAW